MNDALDMHTGFWLVVDGDFNVVYRSISRDAADRRAAALNQQGEDVHVEPELYELRTS